MRHVWSVYLALWIQCVGHNLIFKLYSHVFVTNITFFPEMNYLNTIFCRDVRQKEYKQGIPFVVCRCSNL